MLNRTTAGYLLHARVATGQLLPEVGDVVVVLFQVLLEVVAPEGQQRFLHLRVELWKQRPHGWLGEDQRNRRGRHVSVV